MSQHSCMAMLVSTDDGGDCEDDVEEEAEAVANDGFSESLRARNTASATARNVSRWAASRPSVYSLPFPNSASLTSPLGLMRISSTRSSLLVKYLRASSCHSNCGGGAWREAAAAEEEARSLSSHCSTSAHGVASISSLVLSSCKRRRRSLSCSAAWRAASAARSSFSRAHRASSAAAASLASSASFSDAASCSAEAFSAARR